MNREADTASDDGGPSRVRELASLVLVVLVVGAAAVAIYRNRDSFTDSLAQLGWEALATSLVAALIGLGFTYLQWRSILRRHGIHRRTQESARVFFVSQLGKYAPGAVWPIVVQAEAGRRWGARRRTMVSVNLLTLLVSLVVGTALGGILLGVAYPDAVVRFWWALLVLPLVVAALHPKVMPRLLNRLLRAFGRRPIEMPLSAADTVVPACWSLASWAALGIHVLALCLAMRPLSATLIALCIGGMALAVSAGVLFIPAPAGAGMREVVLGVVLAAALGSGEVLAVVVASRAILLGADVAMAGLAQLLSGRRGR